MKKCQYFGTDGIRGLIGNGFDPELITRIANATGLHIITKCNDKPMQTRPPKVVIGWDTRASCDFIVHIFAGILSYNGIDVIKVGIVPTAALSFLTNKMDADAGIMVSASHCLSKYNGVKVFTPDGEKMSDAQNYEFDQLIVKQLKPQQASNRTGTITEDLKAIKLWQNFLVKRFASLKGSKVKVVLDCAHGSGAECAREVMRMLGINFTLFNDKTNGYDINDGCGATKPNFLNAAMKSGDYDIGFAFDGDADRCIVFDEKGNHIHGDVVIYLLAKYFKDRGELGKNKIAGTILTNLGVEKSLNGIGIEMVRTDVGDASVYYALKKEGLTMGGETCGHVIVPKIWVAGDGLVYALVALSALVTSDKKLSDRIGGVQVYPSASINADATPVQKKQLFANADFKKYVKECQKIYAENRIIVRPSGTEHIVRVTVEGADTKSCEKIAAEIVVKIKQVLKTA